MKKLLMGFLLLGSIIAFTPVAYGQAEQHPKGHGPGQGRELDFTKLKTDLSLTDAQVTSWKALETEYKTKAEELKASTTVKDEDKRVQIKALRDSKEADLKKILSAEQYTKFSSNRPSKGGGR